MTATASHQPVEKLRAKNWCSGMKSGRSPAHLRSEYDGLSATLRPVPSFSSTPKTGTASASPSGTIHSSERGPRYRRRGSSRATGSPRCFRPRRSTHQNTTSARAGTGSASG